MYRDFVATLTQPGSPPGLPAWARDRQNRARRTRARILAVAAGLLEDREPHRISIQELAAGAGTSVGAFYARFPSKEAVFALLGLALLQDLERHVAWSQGPGLEPHTVDASVRSYVAARVTHTRRNRRAILALRQGSDDDQMAEMLDHAERAIHDQVLARLLPLLAAGTPDAGQRAGFALFLADAAVSDAILGVSPGHGVPTDDGVLVEETVRAVTGYLTQ